MVTLSSRAQRIAPGPVRSALTAAAVAALLTACSFGPTSGSSTAPAAAGAPAVTTSPPTTSPSATGRQLAISLTGKIITPSPAQVDLSVGETLTLTVTVDHDDLLHAHGFDIEKTLPARTPTTIALTGAQPGVYEVETHEPALTLLTVAVR